MLEMTVHVAGKCFNVRTEPKMVGIGTFEAISYE